MPCAIVKPKTAAASAAAAAAAAAAALPVSHYYISFLYYSNVINKIFLTNIFINQLHGKHLIVSFIIT